MHTPSVFTSRARSAAGAAALALLLAACGGDSTTTTDAAAAPADAASADASGADPEAAAESNTPLLQASDDVTAIEVLNVADGSIATLQEATDGDRPVLLWFFSPH